MSVLQINMHLNFFKQSKVVHTCNFSIYWETEARKIVCWRLKLVL